MPFFKTPCIDYEIAFNLCINLDRIHIFTVLRVFQFVNIVCISNCLDLPWFLLSAFSSFQHTSTEDISFLASWIHTFIGFVCLFFACLFNNIWEIFSNYFFGYFFQLYLFLLSYGILITWAFLVYFLLFRFFNFYVIPGHSQILSSLHSAVKHIHWGFFISCYIILVQKSSFGFCLYLLFYCCWPFFFFDWHLSIFFPFVSSLF